MLVKIEARFLIFPGTDFHFPSTSVPPGTFFRLCSPDTLARFNGPLAAGKIGQGGTKGNKRQGDSLPPYHEFLDPLLFGGWWSVPFYKIWLHSAV